MLFGSSSAIMFAIVISLLVLGFCTADHQVYVERKERFIKFDAKDNELEIELGISVPVVKVPLNPEIGRSKKSSAITVNTPGLAVAGMLMFTSFFVIPRLFSSMNVDRLRARKTDGSVFGEDGFWKTPGCAEGLLCWASRMAENKNVSRWFDSALESKWFDGYMNGTAMREAISTGRRGSGCWRKYGDCPIANKLSLF